MNMRGGVGEKWGTGVPQVFRSQNSAAGDNPFPAPCKGDGSMTLHSAQTYGLALVLAYVLYSVGGWVVEWIW